MTEDIPKLETFFKKSVHVKISSLHIGAFEDSQLLLGTIINIQQCLFCEIWSFVFI